MVRTKRIKTDTERGLSGDTETGLSGENGHVQYRVVVENILLNVSVMFCQQESGELIL